MITTQSGTFLTVNGLRTHYIEKGTGHPLIMVHGGSPGACARVNWGANVDFFADAGFAVYAYDQPGYGETDAPSDYSLEYRVAHAKAFIAGLGLDSFDLIGNSQGSYIVGRIALEDPRVRRLVLVSSGTLAPRGSAAAEALAREHAEFTGSYEPSLENCWALTRGTFFNQEKVTEEIVRARFEMSTGKNYETQQRRKGVPAPRPIHGELKDLKIPVLLLWGANDSGVALERSLLLLQSIPGAELHIFDRCGHWVQWDQEERFNTIVRDFLTAPGRDGKRER
jgi:2-hydroxy-6-oxonona-2,4-dienedioate hydrolase/4,5:9,10-diseco-3-hydroxy-5,9,17-trioxoandrosta-1(10),2-diene-4-oate hydrolase